MTSMPNPISADEFHRRIIEPTDFIADTEAFVDVRIERSRGKASYSFIGPGVSQNADQKINLAEPHGFNVGAASMPSGAVNNPHLHYTAEVFICTNGSFRFDIGRDASQSLDMGVGDVFAAPTWVFRSFTNTGPDDSWVFVALGGDDTGGIIWSPDILREAADTGLHLAPDYSLIDTTTGGDASGAIAPIDDATLEAVDHYTDAELEAQVVRADERAWSNAALLSSVLEGHGCVEPGHSTGLHRLHQPQVLLLADGEWQITMNTGPDRCDAKPAARSLVSVPAGTLRDFANLGSTPAVAAVICGTDSPNHIEGDPTIIDAARARGWVRDAAGKIAPIALLPVGRA